MRVQASVPTSPPTALGLSGLLGQAEPAAGTGLGGTPEWKLWDGRSLTEPVLPADCGDL